MSTVRSSSKLELYHQHILNIALGITNSRR